MAERGTFRVKRGLAEMLKGGVIMDVTTAEQARIAEESGAVAVMALERVPADIRAEGGVARMASPRVIKEIQAAVTIPVMAKARIGHFAEAQVLQSLEVDYVDESEVLTPADEGNFVGSGIFKSEDPERRARAIVEATTHFNDPERVAAASIELGEPMRGDDIAELAAAGELLQGRGI